MPKFKSNNISLTNSSFWYKLVGNAGVFSLESRIFHSICIGLLLISTIYIPYNLFAGLYVSSISGLLFFIFFFYQYYNSRFKNKPHNSTLFALIGILIFGVNYFTNSGINGSTDLIWPAYLLLVFAISPYKQHTIWLVVYLICFIAIHSVEFLYPHLIKHPFVAGQGQFIDRVTAFPLPVLVIYIVIKFIRRSYDREKKITEEKAQAVEKSNAQILLQKNQLEENNSEKNKLMSIISHDLRSPLTNIQNYLNLLNQYDIDNAERKTVEEALLKSTNNAIEMLSNLLHWSKSQMTGLKVHLIETNLIETLATTLAMEKSHALKKDIDLNYTIHPNLTVIADVDMLQLVVRNLISNAIKFTPPGGNINIEAKTLLNECKITVSDNGLGIHKDKHSNIFSIKSKPEYGTANEKGVGLGLVLCKEFIERQGGKIGFESTMGSGSSFFVFIPINQYSSTTQDS